MIFDKKRLNSVGRPRSCNPEPTDDEVVVKQEFREEVNINTIMRKAKAGVSPPAWMTSNTPRYGDFTDMPATFQEAFAIVEKANQAFESLPIEFRKELDHDPRNLDTAPRELFAKYGLLKPEASKDGVHADLESGHARGSKGDRDLPGKAPGAPNKASGKKEAPRDEE